MLQTNLVSDLPGVAQFQDPHLVNPWGISESAGSPFWISDNNAGVSSLYNTAGTPQALVVSIPAPGDPSGAAGTPTGTVFNTALAAGAFMITDGTHTTLLKVIGAYNSASWKLTNDGTGGTLLTDPPVSSGAGLAAPH